MEIELRPLRETENEDVYLMFQEIPAEEDGFENPASGLSRTEFADFCRRQVGYSAGIGLKPGYVPDTYYLCFADGQPVGFCKLRHYLNEFLLNHGGHIGYGIRPSGRGQGLGKSMLARLLTEARARRLDKVLLVIRDYNKASRRVCETNGGQLKKIEPGTEFAECFYWIEL